MKKTFLLILILLGLRQMALAQGTIQLGGGSSGGNLVQLDVDFQLFNGPAVTNPPSGSASYGHDVIIIPPLSPPVTNGENLFYISISLGTNEATDGFLYQKEDDGSFLPEMELTNETFSFNPIITFFSSVTNYYYTQGCPLTLDQLQSLVEGTWYAEVDCGDNKYVGKLIPMSIEPPATTMTFSPTTEFPTDINLNNPPWNPAFNDVVVAPANNRPATVKLNGSAGPDPFGFPLEYRWLNGPDVLADNTTAITNQWHTGTYQITFEAQDGVTTGSAVLMLDVISPEEAVNDLGSVVEQANLSNIDTRHLTLVLQRAQEFFRGNSTYWGAEQLGEFQNQVRLRMMRTDNTTANWLIEGAQEIIDAMGESGR